MTTSLSRHGRNPAQRGCSRFVSQLIFRGAEGIPIERISLWVDCLLYPPELLQTLEAQTHRRFLKTHLPLDALVFSPKAKYVYISRDGRDYAWSAYNHMASTKPEIRAQAGAAVQALPAEVTAGPVQFFRFWLENGSVIFGDFWSHQQQWWDARRLPNLLLVHYNNLKSDLPGQMRRVASFLGIDIEAELWPVLVEHCTFDYMKKNGSTLVPIADTMLQRGADVERVLFFLPFRQSDVQVGAGQTTRLDIRLDDFNVNTLGDGGVEFAQLLAEKSALSGPTLRASDGKPDLGGIWGESLPSLVGEAPNPLPWADAVAKKPPNFLSGTAICLFGGIPTEGIEEYQLVQTPGLIVILDGGFNPTRLIYLDGRGHPKDFNPSWMGHSVGHWEGDTLLVETTGFNELGRPGVAFGGLAQNLPQTEKLRVTEKFRRPDLGHLEVETTYDDPGAFKIPFTTRYVKSLAPKDWETLEYVCPENNRDVQHLAGR